VSVSDMEFPLVISFYPVQPADAGLVVGARWADAY
jgi:hypothetical protein